jgi:hypothetical protein
VVINPVSDVPLDTLAEEGRLIVRDIGCYAPAQGTTIIINQITERVRALFHRKPLTMEGYGNFIATVQGVLVAPTDRTVIGRIVSVRFSLRKL